MDCTKISGDEQKQELIAEIVSALQATNCIALLSFILNMIYAFKEKWRV